MSLVVNWFEIQLIWLSIDSRFKWFGCLLIWTSSDVVVNWFETQVIRLSIDLRFKWFGCQSTWDSNELVVNWFEIQVIWMSNDSRLKWFGCQLMFDSDDFVKRSFSARFPSKLKLRSSKTKLLCETSFKNDALKIKNEAFVRNFLQKRSFEDQKRSFSARLPSKMKLWSSKTKLFCETSFKNAALKLKNETFLRDFLQKWSFEAQKRSFCAKLPSKTQLWRSKTKLFCETSFKTDFENQKRSFCARLPSKMKLWRSKTKHFCETAFKNDKLTRHLTSEFQYVLTIFKWMLQKYCACHEKVEPRHTKSCNCHAKWSLQSDTSVTWNLQPFHGFCVGGFKHRHHKTRNHCACHAKRIVSDPLQIHHACQRFCNPHELLRLPRNLQPVEIPAPATRNHFEPPKTSGAPGVFTILTSKSIARRRGASFAKLNFQKCSEPATF